MSFYFLLSSAVCVAIDIFLHSFFTRILCVFVEQSHDENNIREIQIQAHFFVKTAQ